MKRSEFVADSDGYTWEDLLSFCSDEGLCAMEDVVRADDLDSEICSDISDATSSKFWHEISDYLNDIEPGFDYYTHDGLLCFTYLSDSDIEDYVDKIIREMDQYDQWDDEEEDEEETEDGYAEEDEDFDEEEDPEEVLTPEEVTLIEAAGVFSVDELIRSQQDTMMVIRGEAEEAQIKREEHRAAVRASLEEMAQMRKAQKDRAVEMEDLETEQWCASKEPLYF